MQLETQKSKHELTSPGYWDSGYWNAVSFYVRWEGWKHVLWGILTRLLLSIQIYPLTLCYDSTNWNPPRPMLKYHGWGSILGMLPSQKY